MKDLYNVLHENRKEATEKLRNFDNTLVFKYDKNNNIDKRPYVLISDRHGYINDFLISKVCLGKNDYIMLYIEDWDEWVCEDECLSTTINNVYQAIDSSIK